MEETTTVDETTETPTPAEVEETVNAVDETANEEASADAENEENEEV